MNNDLSPHDPLCLIHAGRLDYSWYIIAVGYCQQRACHRSHRSFSACWFMNLPEGENRFKDFPEALSATLEIAEHCKFDLPVGKSSRSFHPLFELDAN